VPAGGEQGEPGARVTVVCSAIEHPAVLEVVDAVGGRTVGVDQRGVVDLELLAQVLEATPGVGLVSVMLVNNEVGTVQPIDAIAAVVREWAPQAVLHTDAAQALCWLDVADHTQAADLVTLAAHKCGGPRGIGALVVRDGVRLAPQQLGGGQERGRRSGTNDVASAVAFAVAARAAAADREALLARASAWRAELVDAVRAAVPGVLESAVPDPGRSGHVVPGIVNLCLPTVHSEALLFLLEHDHRVLASAGSSCASGAQEPSHVLAALGIDRALAEGSLRLSMGWSTTAADIAAAVVGVPDAVRKLQAHAHDGAPA
jgi:cysteine desulfurase